MAREFEIPLVTTALGDAEAYSPTISGYIERVIVTNTDLAAGADIEISDANTGVVLFEQTDGITSAVYNLRTGIADSDGAAIEGAYISYFLHNSRIKVVVDDGGNAKLGTVKVLVTTIPNAGVSVPVVGEG